MQVEFEFHMDSRPYSIVTGLVTFNRKTFAKICSLGHCKKFKKFALELQAFRIWTS